MKQRIVSLIFIAALVVSTVSALVPHQAAALSGSEFQPGRIIDDSIFFDPGAMNQGQIQDFLNSKVPTCDTNGTQMRGNVTRAQYGASQGYPAPYPCLKDYRQDVQAKSADAGLCNGFSAGNKSSAQIIYEVSQSCGISAKVLIVLLQKEQSLITDDWPWSIQYRSATGYGCPDTAPCDAEYYGFFNQVYNAARQFKRYARDNSQFNYRANRNNIIQYNPNSGCGSSNVFIQNPATAGLYIYTPYQPNQSALNNLYGSGDSCGAYGNRNFWRMFNDWFGTTISGTYPSPLYRSDTSGAIYAVVDAKKYLITSYEVLVDYGFHKLPVAAASDAFLNAIATGTTLTNVGRKEYDPSGTIFLLDDGKEYAIKSAQQCTDWGIDCASAKVLPNNLFDRYETWAGYLPDTLYNDGYVFKMEAGKRRPLVGPYINASYGGVAAAAKLKGQNIWQPIGAAIIDDRYIIKFGNNPAIYLYDRGKLNTILDGRDFANWGLNSLNGSNVPAEFDSVPLPRADNIRPLVRNMAGQLFIISGGKKYPTAGRDADFNMLPVTSFDYPDSQADRLPTGNLPDILRASASGEIFTVSGGKKRVFPTGDDIKNLGFNVQSSLTIPQPLADSLGYAGLNLAPGRLYKVPGSDAFRLRQQDGYLSVTRGDYPGLPYGSLLDVDTTTGNLYGNRGTYRP